MEKDLTREPDVFLAIDAETFWMSNVEAADEIQHEVAIIPTPANAEDTIAPHETVNEVLEMSTSSDPTAEPTFMDAELLASIEGIPDKMAFKIGEAAEILDIRPYVLRYWESEFDELKPKKSNHNQRMYSRNDVKMAMMIKKLLYKDRFSIEGARKAIKKLRTNVKQETERRVVQNKIERNFDRLHDLVDDLTRLKLLFA